nr:hypothetical protein GCM10020093_064180 [Planobispora longispora]
MVRQESLLGPAQYWTTGNDDPGFTILMEGDLQTGEDFFGTLVQRSHWLLEIDALGPVVRFGIQPTVNTFDRDEEARSYFFEKPHPNPSEGPFFSARIYARESRLATDRASDLARFNQRRGGIRVYLEGFRVLPYGGAKDDWLGLDRDYARRPRSFDIDLDSSALTELPQEKEGFLSQGNDQYFGAVFLTARGAATLRPVVNREGFVEDESFELLRNLVRAGVDLVTRARAARLRNKQEEERAAEEEELRTSVYDDRSRETPTEPKGSPLCLSPTPPPSSDIQRTIRNPIITARQELVILGGAEDLSADLLPQVERAKSALDLAESRARAWEDERVMLRVLAGVGLQLAAFVHEINGLQGQANSIRDLAGYAIGTQDPKETTKLLRTLSEAVDTLAQSLARQSSYLTDIVGPDARRRRRRIRLTELADTSIDFLTQSMADRGIRLEVDMQSGVKTLPIFPAEATIITTNLLTNAIKAAGPGGRIRLRGYEAADGRVVITVENTGVAVDLSDSERWFKPFESTTTEMDIVLGQGLGLGLPITRRMVEEYGGMATFVAPSNGFSTAVEVSLPAQGVRRD